MSMFSTPTRQRSRDISFIASRRSNRRICINRPIKVAAERK
jgi:hypothetical protein